MATESITQLTETEADALVERARALGKLAWLAHRTLSALVGGYPPRAEHNLLMVWEALNRAATPSTLALAA